MNKNPDNKELSNIAEDRASYHLRGYYIIIVDFHVLYVYL